HGFFTVEQWSRKGSKPLWKPILHLDSYQSLTNAMRALEKRGKPGLYRIVQTQRCVWAEMENGKLKLHGSHVSSWQGLSGRPSVFEREKGKRPVAKARQDRLKAKDRLK